MNFVYFVVLLSELHVFYYNYFRLQHYNLHYEHSRHVTHKYLWVNFFKFRDMRTKTTGGGQQESPLFILALHS